MTVSVEAMDLVTWSSLVQWMRLTAIFMVFGLGLLLLVSVVLGLRK